MRNFLAEFYGSDGMEPKAAQDTATKTLAFLLAVEAVSSERLRVWERGALIYQLRGQDVRYGAIRERVPISRAACYDALRRHLKRRRAGAKIFLKVKNSPAQT